MTKQIPTRPTVEEIIDALINGDQEERRKVANRIVAYGIAATPAARWARS